MGISMSLDETQQNQKIRGSYVPGVEEGKPSQSKSIVSSQTISAYQKSTLSRLNRLNTLCINSDRREN